MSEKTAGLAERFVDLVFARERWNEVKTLSATEVQILFEMVSAAGFKAREVVVGRLVGYCVDEDGSSTGETYPINWLCPLKVISEASGNYYFATGWLECAFQHVVVNKRKGREELIREIAMEIERSIPLEPVQLTLEGGFLREYPPSKNVFGPKYFVNHTHDESQLGPCVGVHESCDGWMDRMGATKTHDAIVCRRCHLQVLFPNGVKTYGDLRQALAQKVAAA